MTVFLALGVAPPAWTSEDAGLEKRLARLLALERDARFSEIERSKDQMLLAQVARRDPDAGLRLLAVEGIRDQAVIAELLAGEEDGNNRYLFMERLTDPTLLKRLAQGHERRDVRTKAVAKLSDQAVLASLARGDADAVVRAAAAAVLQDQALLRELATRDASASVRRRAVERLSDEAALREIARADPDSSVRAAAARRLPASDSGPAEASATDASADVRETAAAALPETHPLLATLAGDEDVDVRRVAVARAKDPAVLRRAMTDSDAWVRLFSARRLEDSSALAEFVTSDPGPAPVAFPILHYPNGFSFSDLSRMPQGLDSKDSLLAIRFVALENPHFKDQPALLHAALRDRSPVVRGHAAGRVEDPEKLAGIARNDSDATVRQSALENTHLVDQAVFTEAALKDPVAALRAAAAHKVQSQEVLVGIAQSDSHQDVRRAAVSQVNDQGVLTAIAKADPSDGVGEAAVDRIRDEARLREVWAVHPERVLATLVPEDGVTIVSVEDVLGKRAGGSDGKVFPGTFRLELEYSGKTHVSREPVSVRVSARPRALVRITAQVDLRERRWAPLVSTN